MKRIAVLSGKGGVGKTFVAVNLAYAAKAAVYIDCDVEEPNGHLFFKPLNYYSEEVSVTEIIEEDEEYFAEELDVEIVDESDPVKDGVSSRPKLPSWDDIMFGGSKTEDE
jgi:cellulose biosynthesis protein BcsQ